ncbi:MAG TPA: TIGR01777 family oxidoreductase [Puia sp.]|nr:TIGR01777 family oxidoreductase [Puia sp.]
MKNKTIILAGGSGFIGQALAAYWGRENRIIILSRGDSRAANNTYGRKPLSARDGYSIRYCHWDGRWDRRLTGERLPNGDRQGGSQAGNDRSSQQWVRELEGCDLVVNLAGRSVNCRYTARNRQEIFDSRTDATEAIGEAFRHLVVPPKLWINITSATIYRHAEDHAQDEYTGEIGEGFSIEVCKRWESCFFSQRTPFTRKIALRTAIALGDGGVMEPYLRLVRFGLGGRQGNGRQRFSWVHVEDIAGAIEWLFDRPELEGVYNMSAPGSTSNACFMETLRRLTHTRIGLSAPEWLLRLGAKVAGTETELLLKSRWVAPAKLLDGGFRFRYERLETALQEILVNH